MSVTRKYSEIVISPRLKALRCDLFIEASFQCSFIYENFAYPNIVVTNRFLTGGALAYEFRRFLDKAYRFFCDGESLESISSLDLF